MSATPPRRSPRFVFLTDDADAGPRSTYAWRLDAANNRPLGRAGAVSVGLGACRSAAAAVAAAVCATVPAVTVERSGPYWNWQLEVPGGSAVSTHRYLRRTECLRGFAQFVDAVSRADPRAGAVRCFGPGTLRGYGRAAAGPEPDAGHREHAMEATS